MSALLQQRSKFRKLYRNKRQRLDSLAQHFAAKRLANLLMQWQFNVKPKFEHIGIYLPFDGEISPMYFVHMLKSRKSRINVYAPIIDQNCSLRFARFIPGYTQRKNIYGIVEPKAWQERRLAQLDLVLVPLVAASKNGDRLGMGKGYYDRAIADAGTFSSKPLLVGLAHQCQIHTYRLPTAIWDQPLDYIVTDRHIFTANSG